MADQNLDILIRTLADTSGAQSADEAIAQLRAQIQGAKDDTAGYNAWLEKNASAVGDVTKAQQDAIAATQAGVQKRFETGNIADATRQATEATRAASAATEAHTGKITGLNKAFNLLGHQFGQLGRLINFAFTSPIAFAVAAVAIGLRNISQAAAQLSERMQAVAASTGAAIGDMKGSLQTVLLQYAAANEAFKKSQEDLDTKIKAATDAIDAQRDALLLLIGARKAADLAAAPEKADRAAIEERYRAAEAEVKQRADAATIAARQLELDRLRAAQAQQTTAAQKDLGGRSEFQVKLDLEGLPKQRESLKSHLDGLEAEIKQFEDMGVATSVAALKKFGSVQAILDHVEGLRQAIPQAKAALDDLDAKQVRLTRGQAEQKAADDLTKRIADLNSQLNGLQTRFAAAWQANAIETGGPAAQKTYDAAAGAKAIQSGQAATKQQAEAVNELSEIFGLWRLKNAEALKVLAKMLDTEEGFKRAVAAVAGKTKQPAKIPAPPTVFAPPLPTPPARPAEPPAPVLPGFRPSFVPAPATTPPAPATATPTAPVSAPATTPPAPAPPARGVHAASLPDREPSTKRPEGRAPPRKIGEPIFQPPAFAPFRGPLTPPAAGLIVPPLPSVEGPGLGRADTALAKAIAQNAKFQETASRAGEIIITTVTGLQSTQTQIVAALEGVKAENARNAQRIEAMANRR